MPKHLTINDIGTGLNYADGKISVTGGTGGGGVVEVVEANFIVGQNGYPGNGDDTYINSSFIGKQLRVFRDGERLYLGNTTRGFLFDDSTGTVTFYPVLGAGEQIIIEAVNNESSGYSYVNSLTRSGSTVRLVGDVPAPGTLKMYGTNAAGQRGWYDQPTGGAPGGGGGNSAPNSGINIDCGTIATPNNSIAFDCGTIS